MRWLVCLVMMVMSHAALAGSVELMNSFLKGLSGFQAKFDQTIFQGSKEKQKSTGLLSLEKPGKFRWDYEKPHAHMVLADSHDVWVLDPDLEQVIRRKQATALQGTPAQVLISNEPLEKNFKSTNDGKKGGLDWVKLIPKDKDSQYDRIRLAFKGKDLHQIEIHDKFDQLTMIKFGKIKRNPRFDWDFFLYEPAEGVDVLEQ